VHSPQVGIVRQDDVARLQVLRPVIRDHSGHEVRQRAQMDRLGEGCATMRSLSSKKAAEKSALVLMLVE